MKDAILDHELLRFFKSLLETGSLCKSAERLGLSQSAASRALERLRLIFNDRLFIKSGTGMTPTPRAENLAEKLMNTLDQIDSLVSPQTFSPLKSNRSFSIAAAGNAVAAVFAPALPQLLMLAPNIRFDVFPPGTDLFDRLRDGRLDMALYAGSVVPPDCHLSTLVRVGFSVVMRRGHPMAVKTPAGQAPSQAEVDSYRRLRIHIQGGLKRHDLEEEAGANLPDDKVAVNTQYFFIGPLMLLETDMIAILPNAIAHRLHQLGAWVALPTPWPAHPLAVHLVWHHRVHDDPAITWVRRTISAALEAKQPMAATAAPEADRSIDLAQPVF